MLDSELRVWAKGSSSALSKATLQELLAAETTQTYHSDRYGCAYLTGLDSMNKSVTAWYLTEEDVATRIQLAKGMGITQICVSDWNAATEAFLAGLNG